MEEFGESTQFSKSLSEIALAKVTNSRLFRRIFQKRFQTVMAENRQEILLWWWASAMKSVF